LRAGGLDGCCSASWASAGHPAESRQARAATMIRKRAVMIPRRLIEMGLFPADGSMPPRAPYFKHSLH
jgi:hypothetical protein